MTMRPRSFDPEAATETAVSDLLRRFKALTEEPPPPTGATAAGSVAGPIEPTWLIAASTTRTEIRAVADFKLDGTDDHVEMNAAMLETYSVAAENDMGGRAVMAAGLYKPTGAVRVDTVFGNALVGIGRGTVWALPADTAFASTALIVLDDFCEIGNFATDALGGGG